MVLKITRAGRGKHRFYLSADKMSVLVAVDLLIVLEYTLAGAGAHEVVVALAGCQTAAHSGTRLVAALTPLLEDRRRQRHLTKSVRLPNWTGQDVVQSSQQGALSISSASAAGFVFLLVNYTCGLSFPPLPASL